MSSLNPKAKYNNNYHNHNSKINAINYNNNPKAKIVKSTISSLNSPTSNLSVSNGNKLSSSLSIQSVSQNCKPISNTSNARSRPKAAANTAPSNHSQARTNKPDIYLRRQSKLNFFLMFSNLPFNTSFHSLNNPIHHNHFYLNTFQSLVHYGDNIGAKVVKCLINENSYETQSLIATDYDIYQGPALCITYDAILKDEHWDEIFVNNDDEASLQTASKSSHLPRPKSNQKPGLNSQASKFMSFFHISDFIAILSGFKVAFVDPYERISTDERSYVAIFDLKNDTNDIEQFEDQFKPLEKIFNVPLLKSKFYNGTIIRLPLRTQNMAFSKRSNNVLEIVAADTPIN
ncbi:sacsin [Brachionus plicatilis]|uniref:Sacsin n=1 Tax=Brachionus plicatilis TaxID=10195 RepID=A0A3M7SEX6_BRAPC|nr:sacsin [Brachionus plicatilis]